MNETVVTLVGNAATGVEFRETAGGGMARFRFAATARRWDREQQRWTDGHTSFYTVWAWRSLAANLAGSVAVGEPLVVHGRLKVRDEERDGQRRTFVDVDAVAVGHDLTRGTSAFRRVMRGDPGLVARSEAWVGGGGAASADGSAGRPADAADGLWDVGDPPEGPTGPERPEAPDEPVGARTSGSGRGAGRPRAARAPGGTGQGSGRPAGRRKSAEELTPVP